MASQQWPRSRPPPTHTQEHTHTVPAAAATWHSSTLLAGALPPRVLGFWQPPQSPRWDARCVSSGPPPADPNCLPLELWRIAQTATLRGTHTSRKEGQEEFTFPLSPSTLPVSSLIFSCFHGREELRERPSSKPRGSSPSKFRLGDGTGRSC